MIEQGTPEWHAARVGRVTASKIADVMAKGKGVSRKNYMIQLVSERLSGEVQEGFTNSHMEHGTETEPQARAMYTLTTGHAVERAPFVEHPTLHAGASPDSFVNDDGLLEIKCPKTTTHVDTLLGSSILGKYMKQMQFQMACTGRKWCDFVSFDPRLPDEMQLHIHRVEADPDMIKEIEDEVGCFLFEVDAMIRTLTKRCAAAEQTAAE